MSTAARAVLTAGFAVLLALGAFIGVIPLAIVSLVIVGVFAYGWPTLLNQPWLWGSRTVIGLTGIGAVIAGHIADGGVAGVPFIVAIGVILAFVSEMMRGDGRPRLVESLCGTVGGVVIVVCVAGWSAAANSVPGESLVVAAAACLAVAGVVSAAVPWSGWPSVGLATLAATGVGAALSAALPTFDVTQGLWAGLVAGVLVASLHVLFDHLPDVDRRIGAIAASAVPVLVGGMLIYIVGTLIVA